MGGVGVLVVVFFWIHVLRFRHGIFGLATNSPKRHVLKFLFVMSNFVFFCLLSSCLSSGAPQLGWEIYSGKEWNRLTANLYYHGLSFRFFLIRSRLLLCLNPVAYSLWGRKDERNSERATHVPFSGVSVR